MPRKLRNLLVFVLLLRKNENKNSFDLVGLNSFFFLDYMRVVFSFVFLLHLVLLFLGACFRLDEMFAY